MNLAELNGCLNPHIICDNALLSKISRILDACERSQNLMIGIYLLEKEHFLYVNWRLRKFIGENSIKLLKEGWRFWYSQIDSKEAIQIQEKVTNFLVSTNTSGALTLYYHIMNAEDNRICVKHEVVLHKINRETLAINYLFDVSDKERIEHCFDNNDDSNQMPMLISAREKEILQLIANGFSSKEIADRLFISNHTAISHRKNLIKKFQVKNTAHLIKKATEIIPF